MEFYFFATIALTVIILTHVPSLIWLFAVLWIGVSIFWSVTRMYNRLIRERAEIHEARANITIYLQQRMDEIGALYKITKEFQLHETETLESILSSRQQSMKELSFSSMTELHNQIEPQLLAFLERTEAYPELQSSKHFLRLQKSMSRNEANIASSRKTYNNYVNKFNTTYSVFPNVLFAKMFGFQKEELYRFKGEGK